MIANLQATRASSSTLLSRAAATVAAGIGILVLAGWLLEVPVLKSVYAGITMKPNAALCLVLGGLSVALHSFRRSNLLWAVGVTCGGLIALVGAATLFEHLTGWNLGIDQALFAEPPDEPATASPGRMGLNASTSFLLCGAALVALYRDRRIVAAQIAALLTCLLALLALIGYAYGVEQLYGIARFTGIALQTAVGLLALGIGVLAVRADVGLMAVVSADNAGGVAVRRMLIWVCLFPFLLGWARLLTQRHGHFDTAFGTALFVLIMIMVFSTVVWRVGRRLNMLEGERLRAREVLRETEERFRLLANDAPVLIWISQSDGQRLWFNRGWLAFTGRTLEQECSGGWVDHIHPEDRDSYLAAYGAGIRHERAFSVEFRLRQADSEYRWILETAVPRRISSGQFAGCAASCVDITERKSVERQRDAILEGERFARNELERVGRAKDEFLATLSHELRTPLNAILGWAHILRRSEVDAATLRKAVDVIERNVRAQTRMIDDLLDMSRIISGKLRLDIQPVDLSGVIESVLETVRPAADAKGIRIQCVIEPLDAVVHGDPHRLQQVVWNLLSNAIKFTPKGGRVQVVLKRVNSHVELVISDTGQGIEADFLPHVFERFRQADASTSREFGGLGLGLSIVRQLTELHGGSVRAASDGKGRGSTFTVELPLAAVHKRGGSVHPRATGAQVDGEPVRLAGIRVLVVDDDPDARDLIKHVLEESGASVVVAASAQEARMLVEAQPPQVILSDIGMPGEDGYRFIAGVRRAGVMTPAIALTAFARSEDRTRALLAGYQAHIAKPVEPLELIASVSSLAQAARGAMTS